MMERFYPSATEEEIKKERQKAKVLRKSSWWKRKISKKQCYYCGRHFPENELTMDHIVPLIRGGKSTKSNMVPACKECNNKKKFLLPLEWSQYLQNLKASDPEKML